MKKSHWYVKPDWNQGSNEACKHWIEEEILRLVEVCKQYYHNFPATCSKIPNANCTKVFTPVSICPCNEWQREVMCLTHWWLHNHKTEVENAVPCYQKQISILSVKVVIWSPYYWSPPQRLLKNIPSKSYLHTTELVWFFPKIILMQGCCTRFRNHPIPLLSQS